MTAATSEPVASALAHLAALVGYDTRNPPRALDEGGIYEYLRRELGAVGFAIEMADHGRGRVSLYATRGAPRLLFNVHLDTVPTGGGWSGDPLRLRVAGDRAIGLGACDVKGAAACMLAAARRAEGPAALLFSSDEEAGEGRCVEAFLERRLPFDGVVVAEPTRCRAVLGHRGIVAGQAIFSGTGGHSSSPRALAGSAVHEAVRWVARGLAWAEEEERREVGGLGGIRFNLGVLRGGVKSNVIADQAEAHVSVRPRPGEDPAAMVARLRACAGDPARMAWHTEEIGPPLPSPGAPAGDRLAAALGLEAGPPVDFWTEAALFSAAGYPALVFGPGDITQAHAADEWIALTELAAAARIYERLFSR